MYIKVLKLVGFSVFVDWVRHEACVNINQIPLRMKEPYNQICRSG
jgi:hypothetical protein